jgi:hypothetical protein
VPFAIAQSPCSQEGPMLDLMLCCCHLEIVNKITFELGFVSDVLWNDGVCMGAG